MRLVLVKFIVGTAFVGAVMEESKAMNIFRKWKNGEYSPGQIVGEDSPPQGGWPWAVKMDAVLSVTVEVIPPQQQQIPYLSPNRSGIL